MKVGDQVEGIMGVHGRDTGTIQSIGAPHSSTKSPTVTVKSPNGKVWGTYQFNLKRKGPK